MEEGRRRKEGRGGGREECSIEMFDLRSTKPQKRVVWGEGVRGVIPPHRFSAYPVTSGP